MQHRKERIPKHTGCSNFYDSDPEEEEDEEREVMAVMCHSGETQSSIQVNREDDEYLKQISQ